MVVVVVVVVVVAYVWDTASRRLEFGWTCSETWERAALFPRSQDSILCPCLVCDLVKAARLYCRLERPCSWWDESRAC
ncbi:hypothetical protein E2C01_090339 [Portunus trituberculatus]|uniref:Uncharacterized protein n=1 Tax=Portunus trituberculatus TaxID=210409 RepID=A0A5B7JL41_PORTR|nr:hypothetical protein [Portunus trituberculatus]